MKNSKIIRMFLVVVSFLVLLSSNVYATSAYPEADYIIENGIVDSCSQARLTNKITNESIPVEIHKIDQVIPTMHSFTNSNVTSYVSSYAIVVPMGSISRTESDGGYGMTGTLTVYYDRTSNGVNTGLKLTSISGTWNVEDSSYKLSNRRAYYGCSGITLFNHKYISWNDYCYPRGNSFSFTPSKFTDYVNMDTSGFMCGVWSKVDITRYSSDPWELEVLITF